MSARVSFVVFDEDGDEKQVELPGKYEVCPTCEGHGVHLCEGMRGHANTREEFYESFDDEESAEYFKRGGRYDVQCEECQGKRVVLVVDEEAAERTDPAILRLYFEQERARAEYEAECDAERRAGC